MFDLASATRLLSDYFGTRDDVVLAYLFGSHARRQAGPLSDVDVAVLVDDRLDVEARFTLRLTLIGDLMRLLHTNSIDVIILNDAPLALQYRVLRDGVLLVCRNRQKRVALVAHVLAMYLDFKPVIERHERAILSRARRGALLDGYNPYHGALESYRQRRERLERTSTTPV